MSEYQLMAKQCKCCGKHVPLPTSLKNFNGIAVCPTTYYNIIEYKKIVISVYTLLLFVSHGLNIFVIYYMSQKLNIREYYNVYYVINEIWRYYNEL